MKLHKYYTFNSFAISVIKSGWGGHYHIIEEDTGMGDGYFKHRFIAEAEFKARYPEIYKDFKTSVEGGVLPKEHTPIKHENCAEFYCPICDSGLFVCKDCGLIEGSLTTHCPGEQGYTTHGKRVYAGEIDFIDGEWKNQCSPHSPVYIKKLMND